MTANQIIIPMALFGFVVFITVLVLRSKKITAANAQRDHRANTPDTGVNKAEVARSAMSGMMGRDR